MNHPAAGNINPEYEDKIVIRYFEEADFEYLQRWSVSPEYLKQWAGPSLTYPLDNKQLENYLAGANKSAESALLIYTAELAGAQTAVGHFSLAAIDRNNGSARLGRVVVDPGQQGQGIGLKMVQEAMRIAFEELGLHRMSLGVFSFNTAAIRCYENAGFIREGMAREAALFGNGYVDCIEMSILDREWVSLYRS